MAKEQRPFRDEAMAMRRALPFQQRVEGAKKHPQQQGVIRDGYS